MTIRIDAGKSEIDTSKSDGELIADAMTMMAYVLRRRGDSYFKASADDIDGIGKWEFTAKKLP